ncbi:MULTISPECIES: ABC transporter ATP-binding protein [Metasolibacillus]|uniref:ABC transporter ATP-binding protein n=1 Tax=Metasolibacillus TaxID=2703677 RepID=UPI000791C29D|nr:ABC transporter ATP-binding protein [Metasolibacillus fluoroglycofenilyticus]KYG91275.1 peptide ABC transporter ATP-binding protein [[Bacillus] sp. KCTC 13219]
MANLLEVNNLSVSFLKNQRYIQTINRISFQVKKGEMLGIVGESGCGKSVTSLAITGLLPQQFSKIDKGSEILYKESNLVHFSEENYRKIRGKEIAMIFQDPMTSLNPVFTIGFQLIEMIRAHEAVSKKEAFQKSIEMLKKVGIPRAEQIMRDYPHQLSGGMRQRVMIAMAMSCQPDLLIADEPTTALDVTIQRQILLLMKKLQQEYQTSILLITHDLGVVSEVCDRVIVMYAGEVVEEGAVRQIFSNPKHPYTKGLIQSIPTLDNEIERLETIAGMVPQPGEIQQGCRFANRCSFASENCYLHSPAKYKIDNQHFVNCWLFDDAMKEGTTNG